MLNQSWSPPSRVQPFGKTQNAGSCSRAHWWWMSHFGAPLRRMGRHSQELPRWMEPFAREREDKERKYSELLRVSPRDCGTRNRRTLE